MEKGEPFVAIHHTIRARNGPNSDPQAPFSPPQKNTTAGASRAEQVGAAALPEIFASEQIMEDAGMEFLADVVDRLVCTDLEIWGFFLFICRHSISRTLTMGHGGHCCEILGSRYVRSSLTALSIQIRCLWCCCSRARATEASL